MEYNIFNEGNQIMSKANIPLYTINQMVHLVNFDEFTIVRGILARRHCDEHGNYMYTFKNDRFQVEYEEENIFLTFKEAKRYMEEVVEATLSDVKRITPKDIRNI